MIMSVFTISVIDWSDIDEAWFYYFKNHEEIWLEAAEKLTEAVQQIIEFAKLVPGFVNLMQDDQIMLLKGGQCWNLSLENTYRHFSLLEHCVNIVEIITQVSDSKLHDPDDVDLVMR